LAVLIQSKASQHELIKQKSGTAQAVVNTTRLRQWPIPVPPIKLQNQFASFVRNILEGRRGNLQTRKLVSLQNALAQEMMS
jgi:restriction endonuclease S subunit